MNLNKLMSDVANINKYLQNNFPAQSQKEEVLGRIVKVIEELGEFSNEALSYMGKQRADKLKKFDNKNVEEEFCDVLISLLTIADQMNFDIEKSLIKKIGKLKKRFDLA